MRQQAQGFTMIELLIVLAVISILAVIALSAYRDYSVGAADNACLSEAKAYVNISLAQLNEGLPPDDPNTSACQSIDTAVNHATPVTAIPQLPGEGSISCNLEEGGACTLTPG